MDNITGKATIISRLKPYEDSSFIRTQNYFEVNSTCKGKWQYLTADTILFKCDEEDLSAKLQSGYDSGIKEGNRIKQEQIETRTSYFKAKK